MRSSTRLAALTFVVAAFTFLGFSLPRVLGEIPPIQGNGAGSGGPPTGAAGGDLAGSYPNPTVAQLGTTGASVSVVGAAPPLATYVLTATDATHATWQAPSGGGVTSIAGTVNQITLSASTGAVTVSLPSAITLPGSLTAGGAVTLGANTLALATATVSGTPTWSSSQAITLSTAAQTNVTSLGTLTGLTIGGTLTLNGSTSGSVSLVSPAAPTTTTYTLPAADGTSGQVLSTNGSHVLSFITPSGSAATLAATLVAGHFTGGTNINFTAGDSIQTAGTDVLYVEGTPISAFGSAADAVMVVNDTRAGTAQGHGGGIVLSIHNASFSYFGGGPQVTLKLWKETGTGSDAATFAVATTNSAGSDDSLKFAIDSAGLVRTIASAGLVWTSSTTDATPGSAAQTGLFSSAAGIIDAGNGTANNDSATLKLATVRNASAGVGDLGAADSGFRALYLEYTNTATVGDVTINKVAGRVNMAAGLGLVTVTDSRVTSKCHILCNADSAPGNIVAVMFYAVAGSGSFTINAVPAVTNQTAIDFVVVNAD